MFSTGWTPTAYTSGKLTPAQVLARWLVLVWERPGGEGNDLLREALPGSPDVDCMSNWPLSADVDDELRALVKAGWLEQHFWCPDLTMARYVFPGAPTQTKDSDGIGFYAAGYSYRPRFDCAAYAAFVAEWRHLLATLPRAGKIGPGDRVRLTAQFIASTGQTRSDEARKIWTVKPCSCSLCRPGHEGPGFAAVSERRDSEAELKYYAADPEYCDLLKRHPWRHVNVKNLRLVRKD